MNNSTYSNKKEVTLQEVHDKVKELIYLENEDILDLILAVIISRLQRNSKLWLTIIGRSGIGKSEILELFDDKQHTKLIKKITPNTLISGLRNKKASPDLAPSLKDKVIIMPEMAQILNMNSDMQREIYSQFIDLYDGDFSRHVAGEEKRYEDLNISFIGCSTPAIDDKFLINQSLGTRQIIYRFYNNNEDQIIKKVNENCKIDKISKKNEIKELIKSFVNQKNFFCCEIEEETQKRIEKWAKIVSRLRTTADVEWETSELKSEMNKESVARILSQLNTLFRSLKSLDSAYSTEKTLNIIRDIALSSITPIRKDVLVYILRNNNLFKKGINKRDISEDIKISPKTILRELNILWYLGILNRDTIEMDYERYRHTYKLNKENELVLHLADEFGIKFENKEDGKYEENIITYKMV